MKTLYDVTDKYISVIHKKIISVLSDLSVASFDEIDNLNRLYKELNNLYNFIEKHYFNLAKAIYSKTANKNDKVITMLWLDDLLNEYNYTTQYIFKSEYERKRDRLVEVLVGSKGKDKDSINKTKRLLALQVNQGAIDITDKALVKAYKDMGYKKVVWNAIEDSKVCKICASRDGKIYDIDNIPPKPHFNCRCWLTPYESNS